MQEVKQPNKKPFIFYYLIALVAIMLINSLLVPQIVHRAVKEVDYNTFMQMTYDKQIDEVQVQDNQIVFTAKDDKTIYKTGLMDDPDRTQRLYDSGAKFSSEIVEEASPVLSFLISWLLPLIIIIGFGQLMYRQMAKKAGGDSMMFGMGGMGKSNAKVYVKSSNGIKFTDVAGLGFSPFSLAFSLRLLAFSYFLLAFSLRFGLFSVRSLLVLSLFSGLRRGLRLRVLLGASVV